MFVLADTHIFSPNLVNIARFGYMRFDGLVTQENPLSAQAVGIGTPTGQVKYQIEHAGVDRGWVHNRRRRYPVGLVGDQFFHLAGHGCIDQGPHSMRFGAEFKRHEVDENQPQQVDGNLMVAGIEDFLVGQTAAQNGSPLGLSNVGLSISGGGIFRRDERYTNLAGFAQDDIKLVPTTDGECGLTIRNLRRADRGLRQTHEFRSCARHKRADSRIRNVQRLHRVVEFPWHIAEWGRAKFVSRVLQDTVWKRIPALGIGLADDREADPGAARGIRRVLRRAFRQSRGVHSGTAAICFV